ncbi:MAG TPA: AMP-binding protein [Xanthobacteraceae bacterium]|nr:AMP-binding protein [Xanthobacteraceae bacterium]
MNIASLVERNARLFGSKLAFVADEQKLTHAEFRTRVFAFANALADRGLGFQSRVAILMRNRIECLEAMFGCGSAGFIAVPLNWRLAEAELVKIVKDCQPEALIFEPGFAAAAAALINACPAIRCPVAVAGRLAGSESYEDLLRQAATSRPVVRVDDEAIESLVYTSGTTGDAKGVMLSHRAITEAARAGSWEGGASPTDRTLIVMPLFHVGGKIEQMGFWLAGGTTYLQSAFDAGRALALIDREKLTAAHLAPTMIAMLLDHPDIAAVDHASLRLVHYASAPMPVPLLRRAMATFGPIFVQLYGMTECVLGTVLKAHQHVLDGTPAEVRRLGSAGQPYLGVDVRIERIGGAEGAEAAPGEPGEILLRGPALMSGYWNRTGATLEALRGGYMHTGDIGYVDEDGFLFVVDRKKDMIVSGGENIYSREVEEALATHAAIKEAAVVGVPDQTWGESVFAFVTTAPGATVTADELIAHCRRQIASYKKPRFVRVVEALPRIFNGKVDKKALRAMAIEEARQALVNAQ